MYALTKTSGPFASLVLAAACVAGCTSDPATTADAGDDGADTVVCVVEGGAYPLDTYKDGLVKGGRQGVLNFDLVRADPAPPAQGLNTFMLKVTRADGTPFAGQLQFAPNGRGVYMPIHGHSPSAPIPMIAFDPSQGAFSLTQMNFFMSGLWQVEVYAYDDAGDGGSSSDDASAGTPSVPVDIGVFYFCID
jgi:hypothetical protein